MFTPASEKRTIVAHASGGRSSALHPPARPGHASPAPLSFRTPAASPAPPSPRTPAASPAPLPPKVRLSPKTPASLLALLLSLALVFAPTLPALATQLAPKVTFDGTSTTSDFLPYKLNPGGTEITVTGDGSSYYILFSTISDSPDGAGNLTKAGPGTLYLNDMTNTYTGATIVTDGILQIADSHSINPDAPGNAVSGSNSRLTSDAFLTIGESGTGGLRITDGGKVSAQQAILLSRFSSSSGTITVSGDGSELAGQMYISIGTSRTGDLRVTDGGKVSARQSIYLGENPTASGTATVSGATSQLRAEGFINVGNAGTALLAGTGTVIANTGSAASTVYINSTGTLSAGDTPGAIGTLAIGTESEPTNLQLNKDATLRVDTNTSDAMRADRINVFGDAFLPAASGEGITIDLTGLHSVADAPILSAATVLSTGDLSDTKFTLNGVNLTTLAGHPRLDIASDPTVSAIGSSLELTTDFGATQSAKMIWTGNANTNWDMTSQNWKDANDSTPTRFLPGDWVVFDSTSPAGTVTIAQNAVTVSQMDVTGNIWTFNGNIIATPAAWVGASPAPAEVEGSLRVSGSGTQVTLNGSNAFAGGISISDNSRLLLGSQTAAGDAPITLVNNGFLALNFAGAFANTVSGAGLLTKAGPHTTLLSGDNTYAGGTYIIDGTLMAGKQNTLSPNSVHFLDNAAVLDLGGFDQTVAGLASPSPATRVSLGTATLTVNAVQSGTFAGTIAGAGGLTKTGPGTLELTNPTGNTYTGATIVTGGTLKIARPHSINPDSSDNAVSGSGSVLTTIPNIGMLFIGSSGTGALLVSDGGKAEGTLYIRLGSETGSSGTVTVSGVHTETNTPSTLTATTTLYVGNSGTGFLTVTDGGRAEGGSIFLGNSSGSSGTVTVSGVHTASGTPSTLAAVAALNIGDYGTGALTITDGGRAKGKIIIIGYGSTSRGTVTVSGGASELRATDYITVGRSGTGLLAGTGTVVANTGGAASTVTVNGTGTLSAGDTPGAIGTLTFGKEGEKTDLALYTGATIRVDTNASGAMQKADLINVLGNASVADTPSNTLTIDLTSLNSVTGATILTASDTLATNTANLLSTNFTLNGVSLSLLASTPRLTSAATPSVSQNGNSLELTTNFGAAQSAKMTWTGPTTGNWDMISNNWTGSGSLTTFLPGDHVVFNASGGGFPTLPAGGVTVSQMDVNAGYWTFTGDISVQKNAWVGAISAPTGPDGVEGSLRISGGALVILNGNNSFEGGITINQGRLALLSQTSAGDAPVTLTGSGDTLHLDFNGVFANTVSGKGMMVIESNRTITLGGKSNYEGATVINPGGRLIAGKKDAFSPKSVYDLYGTAVLDLGGFDQTIGGLRGEKTSRVSLGAATLTLNGSGTTTYAGTITGTGGLIKKGEGTTTLTGTNTYTGLTTVAEGYLNIGEGGTTGSIAGDIEVQNGATLDFDRSDNLTYNGNISGQGKLYKNSAGTLTLTSDNSFSGSAFVNSGTLQLGNGGATGSLAGFIRVESGATLIFNLSGAPTHSSLISNEGTLIKKGSGTLTLAGGLKTETDAGDLIINEGALILSAQNNSAKDVTVNPGATLGVYADGNAAILSAKTLTFTGNGGLDVSGTAEDGTTVITTTNGISGFTPANVTIGGSLSVDYLAMGVEQTNNNRDIRITSQLSWNVTDNTRHGTFTLNDAARPYTVGQKLVDKTPNGALWDGRTLTKKGPGTLILTNENTYSGNTNILAGTLQIGDGKTTGSISDTGTVTVAKNAALAFNRFNDITYGGIISGQGNLLKKGAGTLTLTGKNNYSGTTTVNAGMIRFSSADNLGSSKITLNGGGLEWTSGNNTDISARLNPIGKNGAVFNTGNNHITLSSGLSGAGGITKTGPGVLILTGTNNYTGPTDIRDGILQIGDGGTGSIEKSSAITIDTGAALDFNRSGAVAYNGVISGSGRLDKHGTGTLTLTGANTYSGGTIVMDGLIRFADAANFGTGNISLDGGGLAWAPGNTTDISGSLNPIGVYGAVFNTGGNKVTFATALTEVSGITGPGPGGTSIGITKAGKGSLTLAESGTLSNLTLAGGALNIAADKKLTTTGAFTMGAGTTLGLHAKPASLANTTPVSGAAAVPGASPATNPDAIITTHGAFTIGKDSTLNITGYSADAYPSAPQTLVAGANNSAATPFAKVTAAGLDAGSLDSFLNVRLIYTPDSIQLNTDLVWNLTNGNAHGTFTIAGEDPFILDAPLADNTSASHSTHNWDGKTLTKKGTGTLVLAGTNTYTGGTLLNGGRIDAANSKALGTGTLTMAAGTTLGFAADNLNLANPVILSGDNRFDTGTNTVTLSGNISGQSDLIKDGSGTLTLSGKNTYTGLTLVDGGTLALGSALTASSGLFLNDGTTFRSGGHTHSLKGKSLSVINSATYDGNLQAENAGLHFVATRPVTDSMLSVTGSAGVNGASVSLSATAKAGFTNGDTITLLKAAKGLTGTVTHSEAGLLYAGATVVHDLTINTTANAITATIGKGMATEQSKALSEGHLAGTLLTIQGADVAAGPGISSAIGSVWGSYGSGYGYSGSGYGPSSSSSSSSGSGGYSPSSGSGTTTIADNSTPVTSGPPAPTLAGFSAVSSGVIRANTGSHVDMSSVSVLAGLAYGASLPAGRLTLGAFFEYGNGSYDTHNSFSRAPSVKGDGSTWYMGGGVLGRLDFAPARFLCGSGHLYSEASARIGKIHNDYDSSDIRDANGRKVDYETSSPYYSIHLGAGYLWDITEKASLDVYAKYFWTRQEGDTVTITKGERLHFKSTDSQRLRPGARFSYKANDFIAPYMGAAWEYEFDAKARATTNGNPIDAPNLKGGTGIGEIGLSVKPSQSLPLVFDLGAQGYTGKREGVTGSLQIKWEF